MPSFVEALYQRYSDSMCEDSSIELFIVGGFSPGKSGNRLTLPPAISLTRCDIHTSGPENVIKDFCRGVEELDLASNNLTDLNQIFKITKEMPFLKFLNLSENDLSKIDVDQIKSFELPNIRSLVLNNTLISWNAVSNLLLSNMPNLQDLHICLNDYKTLEKVPKTFSNVERIYISKNPNLTNWQQIKNLLNAFPNLKSLTMADCNIDQIPEDLHKVLPKLTCLNISNWPITSWTFIDNLNTLPELNELRCRGVQVLSEEFNTLEQRRNMLIARLPKIVRLNGSEVTNDERLDAERKFLRWFDENKDLEKPKRYYELVDLHGAVPALAEINFKPQKSADVTVYLRKNDPESDCDNDKENENLLKWESKKLKVYLKQSVKELKTQIGTLFKIPSSRIRLFYCDAEYYKTCGAEEMKWNQKKLYSYNVQNGDLFFFDDKENI